MFEWGHDWGRDQLDRLKRSIRTQQELAFAERDLVLRTIDDAIEKVGGVESDGAQRLVEARERFLADFKPIKGLPESSVTPGALVDSTEPPSRQRGE